ncbi:hypothetical protein [Glycomyces tenuis]|uniref:hypothetical protein n=1 Tax=Glycomyces tenuis TaxID=58116 RepID=UPI0003F9997C|nr:hypothetical protein [Glycomyces tenuis]
MTTAPQSLQGPVAKLAKGAMPLAWAALIQVSSSQSPDRPLAQESLSQKNRLTCRTTAEAREAVVRQGTGSILQRRGAWIPI